MKNLFFKKTTLIILSIFLFASCSSDDSTSEEDTPDFAMTFKLNGELYELNNPFGTNEFSNTNIFTYYPIEDFVLLQSRNGFVGNIEIDLWLKRDQIIEGANYQVSNNTDGEGTSTHIDLIDNSNNYFEDTMSGEVTITTVNTTNKIVKGTFNFIAMDMDDPNNSTMNVTEGTFNYVYE